jgi:ribulose-phosphate 3-epimerase
MARLAPSVLAADFARLGEELASAEQAGIDMLHLDIMDGHFVPNISYGPGIVKTIDRLSGAYLDVHLMLSEPEKYFEVFVKAGADCITFHIEVHPEPTAIISQLRTYNVAAGLSINPDLPVEKVLPFLEQVDLLLLMSVFPGFGGQKFMENVIPKIEIARDFIDAHGLKTKISVDGGVDADNASRVVSAGADILVMGTAFFRTKERAALVTQVKKLEYHTRENQ